MKSNLPARLLLSLFFGLVVLLPLPSFAELPKGNSFIPVDKVNEGTELEASWYIDKNSVQKKGNHLYYTEWTVWKSEQPDYAGHQYQYTKSHYIADCQNWKEGRFDVSFINRTGVLLSDSPVNLDMQNPQPETVGFKTMDIVCKGK